MSSTSAGTIFQGTTDLHGAAGPLRVAIVVSRYNESITKRLLDAASDTLVAAGLPATGIDVAWVPGAFELPLVADRMAGSRRYAAVLCLGAIIRGETSHDRHIASAVGHGIEQSARAHGIPVLFGVLTCDTLAQALARAGGDAGDGYAGNKGRECAAAAIEMMSLLARLPAVSPRPS
jgi:6,7-dimethyl-8-ribityllumazine synthase